MSSGVLDPVPRYYPEGGLCLAGMPWAHIPTSPYAFVVLDCTLRRVFYVLPVPKQRLVKRASTKVDEVLLSGY